MERCKLCMICLWKHVAMSACKWMGAFWLLYSCCHLKLKVNVCKMDNCAGRIFFIDCAFCCLEYKCVCPFMLAVLVLEVSVCMLASILIHHITCVNMVSNLQFKITSYVEDTKNYIYAHNWNEGSPMLCIFFRLFVPSVRFDLILLPPVDPY
jgi:hypothetical protein